MQQNKRMFDIKYKLISFRSSRVHQFPTQIVLPNYINHISVIAFNTTLLSPLIIKKKEQESYED